MLSTCKAVIKEALLAAYHIPSSPPKPHIVWDLSSAGGEDDPILILGWVLISLSLGTFEILSGIILCCGAY